jgi:hypothetical protein
MLYEIFFLARVREENFFSQHGTRSPLEDEEKDGDQSVAGVRRDESRAIKEDESKSEFFI